MSPPHCLQLKSTKTNGGAEEGTNGGGSKGRPFVEYHVEEWGGRSKWGAGAACHA
jgi:hypothetical protein